MLIRLRLSTKFISVLTKVTDGYIGGTVWLKRWAEVNGETGRNPQIGKYLGIYFAIGFGSSALVIIQTLILWIFCSIEVCANLRVFFMVVQTFSSRRLSSDPMQHEANAKFSLYLGFPQVTRKNGICHISLANEFLRNHSCRSHPQPFLKASWRISHFQPVAQDRERLISRSDFQLARCKKQIISASRRIELGIFR